MSIVLLFTQSLFDKAMKYKKLKMLTPSEPFANDKYYRSILSWYCSRNEVKGTNK